MPERDALGDVVLRRDADGVARTYRLAVPANYGPDTQYGLILNLHGSGSNADQQSAYTRLGAEGAKRGYVVLTPSAIDGTWDRRPNGADDDFLMGLVDSVKAEYCIDVTRIDAAGISLGSWRATATACTHPEVFAAVALVAEEVAPPECDLAVVAFHGTADAVVPYGEGADPGVVVTGSNAQLSGAKVNMDNWADNAGCSSPPTMTEIGDDVTKWEYPDCPVDGKVQFYSISGGGHTWPGAKVDVTRLGTTTQSIDATAIALDFFDDHLNIP